MNLTLTDGFNSETTPDYLRLSDLQEGVEYTKIAFVTDAGSGLSKANTGFAKFYLKDIDSNVVSAFLFDVQDYIFSGIKLAQFKGKAVKITFVLNYYNGKHNLVINGQKGIEEYTGEIDKSKFIGHLDYNVNNIVKVAKIVVDPNWEFPVEWTLTSFDNIGQGRVGAFAKVLELTFNSLLGYKSVMDPSDYEALMCSFIITMEAKFRIMKSEALTIGAGKAIFDIFESMNNKYKEHKYFNIIHDCLTGICNYGGRTSMHAHLIFNSFNQAVENINLILINKALIVGSTTKVGGVDLSKF